MNTYFFTEGSRELGFGHLTRCLALSQALHKIGLESFFFINGDDSFKNLFSKQNYQLIDWGNNLNKCFDKKKNLVIVDSYLASMKIYDQIVSQSQISVAIDDNCRLNYPINCLINGSVYAKILPYQPSRQIRFLGPEYILLREDFLKEKPNKLSSEIKNILITFGGDDVRHLTLPLLKRLHLNFPKIIKTVILGSGFDNKNEIIRQQNEYIKIIDNPSISTLIKKMKQADCAISAGGQTLNELAFLGIPTIAIKVADNQHNNVSYWSAKGYTINAGNYNNENLFDIVIKAIKKLSSLSERKKRQLMGLKLCDGQGSNRVARQLLQILENT